MRVSHYETRAEIHVIGLLVIVPFILRDSRRYRRTLSVSALGLSEVKGHEITVPWGSIEQVLVREPHGIGRGSINAVTNGGRIIQIPRSMPYAGQVLHLITSRSGVAEVYAHES